VLISKILHSQLLDTFLIRNPSEIPWNNWTSGQFTIMGERIIIMGNSMNGNAENTWEEAGTFA
jgi:hypothetical protein